ncbi:predicted protein [Naegleria gruberi]|uniref:Predicted protein n=1 Tax=Naegleria gruberi TaxID=5762 RepID=D2VNV3_NAEGR|nr:uncharacterized protein NAEGRDRAFT_70630 [Naegleria gruberi]EFC41482.1 predicted protein [Naegleria gruberi]|eukprot:XP_002674226.1 predicted protein [Naegleria gruberi strain NEG-M]
MSNFRGLPGFPSSSRGITRDVIRSHMQTMFSVTYPLDSTSPTSPLDLPIFSSIGAAGNSLSNAYHAYNGRHSKDSDCIPRDIISLKQVTDCPLDPIFDMLGEREFLIKKLHLKRTPHRVGRARRNLLSQIR